MAKILLVDGTNMFIRCYSAVASLDMHGNSNGGIVGSLSSLNFIINQCHPDKVVFVWDGIGGSKKRRAILNSYKNNRKPTRLNRNYEHELTDVEKNKEFQRLRLEEYLKDLPIVKISIDDIEADDVIAYLVKVYKDDNEVMIASSDKDFYQLLEKNVKIFNSATKSFVIESDVLAKFNIAPKNFALARALIGDKSDNVSGIGGVGFKTVVKLFSFISENKEYDLDFLFNFAMSNDDKKYVKILQNEQVIRTNFKVMNLKDTLISYHSVNKINECINAKNSFGVTSFRLKLLEDGITNFSDNFFKTFRLLDMKGN
jgi:5'-3' exonuclease